MSTTGKAATVVVGSLIGSYALWKCLSNHPTSNLKSTESTGSHEYLHKVCNILAGFCFMIFHLETMCVDKKITL